MSAPRPAILPDLEGRSAFITGGGSGIGAALTEGFAAQGARVAFVQRSDAAGLVEAAAENGPITVLVNNAANDVRHPVEGRTVEDWDPVTDRSLVVDGCVVHPG